MLSRKLKESQITNITSNSLHPGVIAIKLLSKMGFPGTSSLKKRAETSIYLATSEDENNISGKYFIKKRITETNKIADDLETQNSLWKLSEELLGFKFDL